MDRQFDSAMDVLVPPLVVEAAFEEHSNSTSSSELSRLHIPAALNGKGRHANGLRISGFFNATEIRCTKYGNGAYSHREPTCNQLLTSHFIDLQWHPASYFTESLLIHLMICIGVGLHMRNNARGGTAHAVS